MFLPGLLTTGVPLMTILPRYNFGGEIALSPFPDPPVLKAMDQHLGRAKLANSPMWSGQVWIITASNRMQMVKDPIFYERCKCVWLLKCMRYDPQGHCSRSQGKVRLKVDKLPYICPTRRSCLS